MMVRVVGAGLAGCEAAWQLAIRGVPVLLFEMKPKRYSPAHQIESLAELVCSNSLKAQSLDNASGLLKEELRRMGSLLMTCADACRVPAGGALAVDRRHFSDMVTAKIRSQPLITVIREEVCSIGQFPKEDILILATGPLTADALAEDISSWSGLPALHFYDAAAPIVSADSLDDTKIFRGARYGKGTPDYINCPMNKAQYLAFYDALVTAEGAAVRDFDEDHLYEGCMPVESMAKRGVDTLRFGPLKPVGLRHPLTGEEFYAVVQLRQDNAEGTMYNLVGFQTRLRFPEQARVFRMIPGLEQAEFLRYGVMHRNTYLQSPGFLDETYRVIHSDRRLYFAGQITGVEGYMESASSGLVAGINAARESLGQPRMVFSPVTMTGALARYVAHFSGKDFQPMGANFGILSEEGVLPGGRRLDKKEKKRLAADASLRIIDAIQQSEG